MGTYNDRVFVRLFAILLALGMLVISTQASDLATTGPGDTAAIVDEADELPPIAVIESPAVVSDAPSALVALPAPDAPIGHRPEIMIFRPPRAAAFV
jgi:hypothetical protein